MTLLEWAKELLLERNRELAPEFWNERASTTN
jgi:hypothetical protein